MAYPKNSWAILPATDAIFGKTKVTIEAMMLSMGSIGDDGTMLIVERENGDGKVTRFVLSSAGDMTMPIGKMHKAHHDQNLRPYGMIKVLAVIRYGIAKGDDGKMQVVCTMPQGITLDSKFPLFVFK